MGLASLAGCSNAWSPIGVYELNAPERIGSIHSARLELRVDGTAMISARFSERTRKGEIAEKVVFAEGKWNVLNDSSPEYRETLSSSFKKFQPLNGRDYVILQLVASESYPQSLRRTARSLMLSLFGPENLRQAEREVWRCETPTRQILHSITDPEEREKKAKEIQDGIIQAERNKALKAVASGLIDLRGMGLQSDAVAQLIVSHSGDLLIPGHSPSYTRVSSKPKEPKVLKKKQNFPAILRPFIDAFQGGGVAKIVIR
jgi:hypothetical protein